MSLSSFCIQLDGFKYFNQTQIFLFTFVCTHLKGYTYDLLVISFLNGLEQIYLHTNFATVSTQLNGFNYCYLTFQFNINHLFADSEMVTSVDI